MLVFKNKTNAFSSLFFAWVVDPSGLASGGSSLKLKADLEEGKVQIAEKRRERKGKGEKER